MNKTRQLLRWLRACLVCYTGVLWCVKIRLRHRGSIVILALHRVMDDDGLAKTASEPSMIVRRATFEALAKYASTRYKMVDLAGAAPARKVPSLAVAISFDDGWSDNYRVAFPIARRLGLPFTIFVCPGLVGVGMPFWPERVAFAMSSGGSATDSGSIARAIENLKRQPIDVRRGELEAMGAAAPTPGRDGADSTISWDEIREMSHAGVTFGSHTQMHEILPLVDRATARLEIANSKAGLERELQSRCHLFAYPNGDHSPQTRRLVADAGFTAAFTITRGAWTAATDPFAIPRRCLADIDLVGPRGRFSAAMADYAMFWTVWRSGNF